MALLSSMPTRYPGLSCREEFVTRLTRLMSFVEATPAHLPRAAGRRRRRPPAPAARRAGRRPGAPDPAADARPRRVSALGGHGAVPPERLRRARRRRGGAGAHPRL